MFAAPYFAPPELMTTVIAGAINILLLRSLNAFSSRLAPPACDVPQSCPRLRSGF